MSHSPRPRDRPTLPAPHHPSPTHVFSHGGGRPFTQTDAQITSINVQKQPEEEEGMMLS